MSADLLQFQANLNITLSSIMAAVIAFMFSARNGLQGQALQDLVGVYNNILFYLIIIFSTSLVPLLYFLVRILWISNVKFCDTDFYFSLILMLIFPSLAFMWFYIYKKD